MIASSKDQLRHSQRCEWLLNWPGQVVLTSAFIEATSDCHEAIKGGGDALKALEKQYQQYHEDLLVALQETPDPLVKFSMTALLLMDMKTVALIQDLLRREVESDKDFGWKIKPRLGKNKLDSRKNTDDVYFFRCYLKDEIFVETLGARNSYSCEYLGDCSQPVWTPQLERALFTFMTAFKLKHFALVQGDFSTGKNELIKELVKLLAVPFYVRNVGRNFHLPSLQKVSKIPNQARKKCFLSLKEHVFLGFSSWQAWPDLVPGCACTAWTE